MRRAVVLVLALVAIGTALATAAAAIEEGDPTDAPTTNEDLVALGRELYGEHCAICHGAEGRGTDRFPSIQGAPPALVDFMIRTGRMPLPSPSARSVRRPPVLDERQRLAIVAYIKTFAPDEPEIPDIQVEEGDLARGRELFEANCIACHSAFGRGIAVGQEDIAPAVDVANPVEMAEAVRTGPGVMPPFGEAAISDDAMDDLIAYIVWLTRQRETPGGITLGRSGPVTEGFVAWGGGLLVLLVIAYFIGERRRGG